MPALDNNRIDFRQPEGFTQPVEVTQSVTPQPLQVPAATPGTGVQPLPTPATPKPEPVPTPTTPAEPKPLPVQSGTTPAAPKPLLEGAAPPSSTPSGGTAFGTAVSTAGGGGGFDWRAAVGDTDRNVVTRSVQDSELTSRQLSRLLDENGRYIQSARLRAREGAAERGMLTSSFAAGAAERAAIDAGLPIAQADANTYFSTASENMRAQNEDVLADQGAGRQLLSQGESQRFQSGESAANRSFQAAENALGRNFQAEQSGIERDWRSMEAGRDRSQQFLMQERGFSFNEAQAAVDRGFRAEQAGLDRQFNASQGGLQRQQQRISEFNNLMANRELQLSNQLAAIFSNTNLTAEQQRAAADNARSVFTSTTASFNAVFAQGVPEIFMRPYEMQPGAGVPPPTTPVMPPGMTPIPGTDLVRDQSGVIRRMANIAGGG